MKRPQLTRNIIIILMVVLIVIVGGIAVVYWIFRPAATLALPEVPTYEYFTPAPVIPLVTNLPISSPTVTSTSTAQSFSFLSLFNGTQTVTPTSTTAYHSSTVIFRTATKIPSIINIIIPTQTLTLQPMQSQPTQTLSAVSDCNNILYPMIPGQAWDYLVTVQGRSVNVLMSIVSVAQSQGVVDVVNQSGGESRRTVAKCDRDTILNFPALSAEVLLSSALNGQMKADYVSGILAPNEAAFVANNWAISWTTQYLVSGSSTINFRGNTLNVTLNPSNMQMTCQTLASGTAAFETVTVSAGTFNAIKVVCRGQGQVTGVIDGTVITGEINAQSTQWFAPHVGMVKMQSDFANIDVFGITIPLNTTGISEQIELRSFKQAP